MVVFTSTAVDYVSLRDIRYMRKSRAIQSFGLDSVALYDFANLVLHYNWLTLFHNKAACPYEDSELEVFQLLISGLEFHLNN